MPAMPRRRYLILPLGIAAIGIAYYLMSHEWVGSVMLIVFALAMTIYGWILLPTANDVGPTAPIDPDWEPGTSRR
jgi:hypothetical protein